MKSCASGSVGDGKLEDDGEIRVSSSNVLDVLSAAGICFFGDICGDDGTSCDVCA